MLQKTGIIYQYKKPSAPSAALAPIRATVDRLPIGIKPSFIEEDTIEVTYDATSLAGLLHPEPHFLEPMTLFEGSSEEDQRQAPSFKPHASILMPPPIGGKQVSSVKSLSQTIQPPSAVSKPVPSFKPLVPKFKPLVSNFPRPSVGVKPSIVHTPPPNFNLTEPLPIAINPQELQAQPTRDNSESVVTDPLIPKIMPNPQHKGDQKAAQMRMATQGVVNPNSKFQISNFKFKRFLGIALVVISLIGMSVPIIPKVRLEAMYQIDQMQSNATKLANAAHPLPPAVPVSFDPLIGPDGKRIVPVNTQFSIIIPKVGINSAVIPGVDPLDPKSYTPALLKGVAQAKTSYFPDQDGAVYLFSHSTNYQWFVKDLNAIFYNVKNLEPGDLIVVYYKNQEYTYKFVNKTIVSPSDTSYLLPITGKRMLILQTCWPPGSTTERLLIFADLVSSGQQI